MGLVHGAVVAVQGVTHLVRQGEHAVEGVLVVEQDVGVRFPGAGGIGAAALALVLVHVDPAVLEALPEQRGVILAQHRQRFQHGLLRLGEGNLRRGLRHDGGVHVVHVQLVHAEELLAQGDVGVHLVEVPVHGLNETVVDALGHLGRVQGGGEGVVIAAGGGLKTQHLKLRVQRRGQGAGELAHAAVAGPEGVAAQGAVGALQQRDVAGAGEGMGVSLAVGHIREAQIRVTQDVVDVHGALGHLSGRGEQLFLRRGEDVRGTAADVVERAAVGLQVGLGDVEQVQPILVDGHDLRRVKGGRRGERNRKGDRLAAHVLIAGVAGVLIALAGGVGEEPTHALPGLVPQAQKL